jgi:hypothetical protein
MLLLLNVCNLVWFQDISDSKNVHLFPVDGAVTARDMPIASGYYIELRLGNYEAESFQS